MNKSILALAIAGTILFSQYPSSAKGEIQARSDIENKYKWNTQDIYPSLDAWEKDFNRVQKELIPNISKFQGKLNRPETILACFQADEELSKTLEKINAYAHLTADENQKEQLGTELTSRVQGLLARASEASAFIHPELLAQPENELKSYIKNTAFKDYRHFLEILLRLKPHTLSQQEEALLASISELTVAPENIFIKATTADLEFPKIQTKNGETIQLSEAKYLSLMQNKDRDLRKAAYKGIMGSYAGQQNTLAATLSTKVKAHVNLARIRKYPSALNASLESSNVPSDVYNNLVKATNGHLSSLHKYIALRKKIMQLDKLHMYDLMVPLVRDVDKKISFAEGQQLVLKGLEPLGSEYQKVLKDSFNNRWIDVYPTKNKKSGAYCFGVYGVHPYLLLNYNETIEDVLTLAHELGHAMHNYYSTKNQSYFNSGQPIFTAEVASTTNEFLLNNYLIEHAATEQEKLFYVNHLLETIRNTFFTQVMYSEFEQQIHERIEKGEALSAQTLNDMWKRLLQKYYGPDMVIDNEATSGWARIPHFYYNFYVFKYATSIAAANTLVQGISSGDKAATEKYLNFLKAGDSDYPVEILKQAGVHMESPQVINDLLTKFDQLVAEMEKLVIE
ncbi:oligoendopeptidase F [Bacillota bacterium LX-D]|nr:oligoendopeptidase F [Bacillota bacterium LX-D]